MPRTKRRVRKITRKDLLLKKIYDYKDLSSEAICALDGDFYTEKLIERLLQEGLIKKSNLKNSKETVKKAGITAKIHRYYVTAKGSDYLSGKFPGEIEATYEVRKMNNSWVERAVKISDTSVMAEVAGAYIINENDHDNALRIIVNENINRGVFFPASVAKQNLDLTQSDVSHYKFTALTGALLTPATPYMMYHAGGGLLTQTTDGERSVATRLLRSYAAEYGLYRDISLDATLVSSIILCRGPIPFARLVTNHYGRRVAPGAIFDKTYIIPVSRNGCNIIRRLTVIPDYKDRLITLLCSDYGYTRSVGNICNCMPILDHGGTPAYIGVEFEANHLRMALRIVSDVSSEYKKMLILCFDWQQEYYNEVIDQLGIGADKITCQPVNEDVLDEVIGFNGKISAVSRNRKVLKKKKVSCSEKEEEEEEEVCYNF
jgi:hypothetical protein